MALARCNCTIRSVIERNRRIVAPDHRSIFAWRANRLAILWIDSESNRLKISHTIQTKKKENKSRKTAQWKHQWCVSRTNRKLAKRESEWDNENSAHFHWICVQHSGIILHCFELCAKLNPETWAIKINGIFFHVRSHSLAFILQRKNTNSTRDSYNEFAQKVIDFFFRLCDMLFMSFEAMRPKISSPKSNYCQCCSTHVAPYWNGAFVRLKIDFLNVVHQNICFASQTGSQAVQLGFSYASEAKSKRLQFLA